MKLMIRIGFLACILHLFLFVTVDAQRADEANLFLNSSNLAPKTPLTLSGLFYETAKGRTQLPVQLTKDAKPVKSKEWRGQIRMPDGRNVIASVVPQAQNFILRLSAQPDADIIKWGLQIDARADEFYTG